MKEIVVDASVVVKWYIEEKDSVFARILRDQFIEGKIDLLVPSIMYFEVLNALNYSELFEPSELINAGESLENYNFSEIKIKKNIRKDMINIAVDHRLSIYDASYVAIGIALGKLFCTADERIIKKLPSRLRKNICILKEIRQFL